MTTTSAPNPWRKALLAVTALIASAAPAAALTPADVLGRWKTQTHDGIIEITPCGDSVCGRIVTSTLLAQNPQMQDVHNPQPELRGRPLIGLTILQGFHQTADALAGGTIYNPDDGHIYHARVTVIDADHLRVRGCIFVPLCQSQIWTRAP